MLEYDWENSVGYWICLTSHEFRKALGHLMSKEGITLRQWEVLACLSARECCSQAELAEYLSIEPHTLAGVLKRMQEAGLLERRSCPDDRRRNRIFPTAAASEIWDRVAHVFRMMRQEVVAGISAEELAMLKLLCGKLRENISRVAESQNGRHSFDSDDGECE